MMIGLNAGSAVTAKRIKNRSVGVEIGVWRGDTSARFLRKAAHLHLVDPWSVAPYSGNGEFASREEFLRRYAEVVGSTDESRFAAFYDQVHREVVQRFAGDPVTIHRMTSRKFFETFAEKVDWVYIDGLHSFQGCLADLRGAHRIVKPGGSIYGDDYGMRNHPRLGGVTRAVDLFARENGLQVKRLGGLQFEIRV
jgi:hypothetical protein